MPRGGDDAQLIGSLQHKGSLLQPLTPDAQHRSTVEARHRRMCCAGSAIGVALGMAVILAAVFVPAGASASDAAYQFSVCSKGGGAQGVDFRSHFSVYGAQHGIQGWVRNACNDCVYGEFSGKKEPVDELAAIMRKPERVLKELASKAFNVTTTVARRDKECTAALPKEYKDAPVVQVDWAMGQDCTSACSCTPTGFSDCQQTTPLPDGAPYTKDCQRAPLGNTTKDFCDCNSVHIEPLSGKACYGIEKGEIVPTGDCKGDWADKTYAALSCCEKAGSAPGGRQGIAIPPAPAKCAAYSSDDGYKNRCPKTTLVGRRGSHPLE